MALNDTLKTRILLRNDTLANWESSSLVLGKGEVAIATLAGGTLAEVRVGTGTSTWANSLKLDIDADQISGLIEMIKGTAKKYQVVRNGVDGNSWKLQEAALSGGAWSDVSESIWTVDFTAINDSINALNETVNTVSSDYVKATVFASLSNEIGLSAASASNHVATKADIAALDSVMHFKGVVNEVPTSTKEYEVGDVVLVSGSSIVDNNGKEFVLVEVSGTKKWEQIGDQDHYATKTLASQMSAYALEQANDYTDSKFSNLSDYYTKDEVDTISGTLSTDYVTKIKAVDDKLTAYALSTDVTSGIAAAKSEVIGQASDLSSVSTVNGAKAYAKSYTDAAVANLGIDDYIKHGECIQSDLSGYFVFECGGASLREDEPTA